MRVFNEQLEAMTKLKGKGGQQRVIVEHVTVAAGGQAIVGAVMPRGEGYWCRPPRLNPMRREPVGCGTAIRQATSLSRHAAAQGHDAPRPARVPRCRIILYCAIRSARRPNGRGRVTMTASRSCGTGGIHVAAVDVAADSWTGSAFFFFKGGRRTKSDASGMRPVAAICNHPHPAASKTLELRRVLNPA